MIKAFLFYLYSKYVVQKEYSYHSKASLVQRDLLLRLIRQNETSEYGSKYNFFDIHSIENYKNRLPLILYEDILEEIDRVKSGKQNILTSSPIQYLLMTSGTSAGTKYIPITRSGLKHQINAALKLLCFYAIDKGHADFMSKKMLFLQGSPKLDQSLKIPTGRLSGVVYHHVPQFFQRNRLPKYMTNIIEDWQDKINNIADECLNEDISVFGGIPPWCIQFFELLCEKKKAKNLKEIFPSLAIYIHGGVDFSSYKSALQKILTKDVDMIQTFPASEGFFGIQDKLDREDMLLLLNQGIYYEFIPYEIIDQKNPQTLSLEEIELEKNYELIITNNSGLWRYRMGDLIQFTSISPYRIRVTGRTSQYISAFGEHVIGYEIEQVMNSTIEKFNLQIEDYHVSPNIEEKRYEWRIEWKGIQPNPIYEIESYLDISLSKLNKYYKDLIKGSIVFQSKIFSMRKNTFSDFRKQEHKEGGQNKVIRLANQDAIAKRLDSLTKR